MKCLHYGRELETYEPVSLSLSCCTDAAHQTGIGASNIPPPLLRLQPAIHEPQHLAASRSMSLAHDLTFWLRSTDASFEFYKRLMWLTTTMTVVATAFYVAVVFFEDGVSESKLVTQSSASPRPKIGLPPFTSPYALTDHGEGALGPCSYGL